MALVINPEFLLLDEPTSGIDQASAVEIWGILKIFVDQNPNTTILLTTHEMTEAEALGSSIAFLKKGRLRAFGSLEQLTAMFQIGYSISFAKEYDNCEDLIRAYFPNSERSVSKTTKDITFKLGAYKKEFLKLLNELDKNNVPYKFLSGSLREVFIRISDEADEDENVEILK